MSLVSSFGLCDTHSFSQWIRPLLYRKETAKETSHQAAVGVDDAIPRLAEEFTESIGDGYAGRRG